MEEIVHLWISINNPAAKSYQNGDDVKSMILAYVIDILLKHFVIYYHPNDCAELAAAISRASLADAADPL